MANSDKIQGSDDGAVHKTRDIYLAAFCRINGCSIKIETFLGGSSKGQFLIACPDVRQLQTLVGLYFKGQATCDVKQLKHEITDLKNQLYSAVDNERINSDGHKD